MAIECRCPSCGRRFKAADVAAGRRVQCSGCQVVIQLPALSRPSGSAPSSAAPAGPVPAAAQPQGSASPPPPTAAPSWLVRTAEGKQHGPMAKGQLDQLVAEHRVDAFCEVRRANWEAWKMIEEVYPSMAMAGEDELTGSTAASGRSAAAQPAPRVQPCPDCGQTVSLRAVQCPHCGCPLAQLSPPTQPPVQPPPAPADSPRSRASRRTVRQVAFIVAASVLLIGIVGGGIYMGYQIATRPSPQVVLPTPEPAPVPAPVAPPPRHGAPTAEQVAAWKDEIASDAARQVDDNRRRQHEVMTLAPQLGEYAKLLQEIPEMANPSRRKSKEQQPASPLPDASKPFVSEFENLRTDCRAYLDKHVAEPIISREQIAAVAQKWIRTKMPGLEEALQGLMPPQPSSSHTPLNEHEGKRAD